MLSMNQIDALQRNGLVKLEGAVARADAEAMANRVWRALAKSKGIVRGRPDTWKAARLSGLNAIPKSENFPEIASPSICAALDDVLGRGNWSRPARWGSILVCFPESDGAWDVPHQVWHLDYPPPRKLNEMFLARIFVCLADLAPRGGATLALTGSHRMIEQLATDPNLDLEHSRDARIELTRRSEWIRSLCSSTPGVDRVAEFMRKSGDADGVELRVVELTGAAGDAWLMHPLMLHALSPNCATTPRMVLSSTVHRAGVTSSDVYPG
jgi:ectoine hydroxylase-related dioxygenase (phytanoyl-CoA dioxygenase family)